jgi:hypothetical protein
MAAAQKLRFAQDDRSTCLADRAASANQDSARA